MTQRFSANLGFLWSGLPLLARIDAAAQAGFRAVELHWPYEVPAEEVSACCKRHGIELLGLNTPVGDAAAGDFGLGAQPGREEEFRDGFTLSLDYLRRAGGSSIHVMAGVTPPGAGAAARETLIANLAHVAKAAPGVTLLLEPINQRDKPGYFYSTISEAAGIIAEVGADNVRIMFDCYHVGVSEGEVIARLEEYMPLIGHVQIASVPARIEPDVGDLDYRNVFATLDRLGYSGWIGCEYKPRAGATEGLAWVAALGVTL